MGRQQRPLLFGRPERVPDRVGVLGNRGPLAVGVDDRVVRVDRQDAELDAVASHRPGDGPLEPAVGGDRLPVVGAPFRRHPPRGRPPLAVAPVGDVPGDGRRWPVAGLAD
ncbi:hypothetical protein BRC92_01810 [Halobacteriales archaeon QS_4_69_31]|nr:MAG: hypothetical protein BRC92_01810 [Halobacteriales archaeon QS_4_69_31]